MVEKNQPQKPGFVWLLRMAWRDGRSSWNKILLFMLSTVLGIAAVVSIQSFGSNLKDNIALRSKALMGADYIIDSDDLPNERVNAIIDSLGGADAQEVNFASMAAFNTTEATKLVRVRGIEGGFPFYGELETQPEEAANNYQEQGAALVDATLMLQFGLEKGDTIHLGKVSLPIAGSLKSIPGSNAIFSSIAPPVAIPYRFIASSELIQTGSRVDYEYYFKDEANTDLERLDRELDPMLDAEGADLDTHLSTSQRLGRRYENFGKFLNLVAFIALLLGCVGIASAIHLYIKEKLPSIAVLKCLGASRAQTFKIFLIQVAFIGLMGGIIGTAAGIGLQFLFPALIKDLIPVQLELSVAPEAVIAGLLLGVSMSVLFALYPLIGTLYVSPLQALRVSHQPSARSKRSSVLVFVAIFASIFIISLWLLEDWQYSLAFMGGTIVTFAVLAGIAQLFIRSVRKYFPHHWNFEVRQSLLNLFRPNNQTLILVLAIGVGTFLISTLYFSRDLLLAEASIEGGSNSPNMILLDVQTGQEKEVLETIRSNDQPVLSNIPIVTMRVDELKGKPVREIRKDTSSTINRWILNHEFRTTYRDSLIDSETLEEGEFTREVTETNVIPISVSRDFAGDAEVSMGDTIRFNVQGKIMTTTIGSIRAVDWSRLQPNFSIVFPKGVLEQAPQFRVVTTKLPTEEASAKLQQKLVAKFPNVSILDLRQVLNVIEELLEKIAWIINFMASFSILTGIIVLLGAVRSSKYQRMRESVLLRTLGAKGKQVLRIVALEYLYLGILGALSGILLSLLGSQLLAWFVFDTTFSPSLFPFLVLLPGLTLLILIIGLSNSIGVIKSPPLEVLRKEAA
ncbi:ABC transporter permease [Robertkochia aurantiaca]|uniref:ABC transporter permease n=1 Tax=Robertkochia aurantiaca TaxID=2873700 RepID=UPI001CCD9AC6|nr:FtsX-like permease family protein [Robertkochia sp. 3YJGBD-33]